MNLLLNKVKLALRRTGTDFDMEILDLIKAALADLGIAGITNNDTTDPLIITAVSTYCKVHFGSLDPDEYDRLKASYDEQKSHLSMATGYTDWGHGNGQE